MATAQSIGWCFRNEFAEFAAKKHQVLFRSARAKNPQARQQQEVYKRVNGDGRNRIPALS